MKTNKRLMLSTLFVVAGFGAVMAQESAENPLAAAVEQLQSDNDIAKRLQITGYVQAQYQKADTAGISSMEGGNFGSGIDNRFMVRRGRLKVGYTYDNAQAVMQLDMTEKGLGLKDAYVSLTEPWLKAISLTGGVFNRPFGYEVSYSSSSLESPERARVIQTLFPGEEDLGGKLTLQAPKTSPWNFIKLDVGLFAGNGINVETDSYKDLIAHLSASKATSDERLKWGLGASFYAGGFATTTAKTYSMTNVNGVEAFTATTGKKGDETSRQYLGLDGQFSYDWTPGITQLKAEYLSGKQPGMAASNASLTAAATGDVYNRDFNGYYVYLIQNILQSPFQAVVKYDVYDPNTAVSGNEIGKT
ncbi:MAG: hypothetical protein Q8914_10895, partial [Bacteroidota bacterium]|nr:hypothetical protein [Bacteroidota bacterium]